MPSHGVAQAPKDPQDKPRQHSIVSLAPSVTETLFAMGLGEHLVGVTTFCDHPVEAVDIYRIGGFMDPSLELVVSRKPSLVIGIQEHALLSARLKKLGLNTLLVDHSSVEGVIESARAIGAKLGEAEQGESLAQLLESQIKRIRGLSKPNQKKASVLILVGSHSRKLDLTSAFAAGPKTIFHSYLSITGGINVIKSNVAYSKVSVETLLSLNPEIIVVIAAGDSAKVMEPIHPSKLVPVERYGGMLNGVSAIEHGRIFRIDADIAVTPGPRTPMVLLSFVNAIHGHPEGNAENSLLK